MIRTITISLCTLLLFSCVKERKAQPETKPETVIASIQGRVLDETGSPVANITVKSLDASTVTSIDGEFRFDKVNLEKTDAYVYAEAAGYYNTGKTFNPQTGNIGFTEIQLIRKDKIKSVPATSPGLITFEANNTIQLPENGVINKTQKTAYSGEISVFASYLSPSTLKNSSIRPGGNYGYDRSGKKKTLRPYGMLAIELEGTGGEQLQLANGKTAVIKIAIPASMAPAAPATIPLWYFDEEKGIWKEEGTATKQGDVYVGVVNHFSFWSADLPEEMINLSMQLKNVGSLPFSFHMMRISETGNDSSYTFLSTDSSGSISTPVPRNKELRVRLYNNCGLELKNYIFPPMQEDKNMNVLTVDAPTTTTAILRGKLTTCNGTPLVNGYALIQQKQGHFHVRTDNQGQYVAKVNICTGTELTVAVIGVDSLAKQESSIPYYQKVVAGQEYIIPTIQACGLSGETYFDVEIDGQPFNFALPIHSFYGERRDYASMRDSSTYIISIIKGVYTNYQNADLRFYAPPQPGSFPISGARVFGVSDAELKPDSLLDKIHITEYGVPGQFITGSFATNMINKAQPRQLKYVSYRFRVRRLR
jgi:hypothetical protein